MERSNEGQFLAAWAYVQVPDGLWGLPRFRQFGNNGKVVKVPN